MVKTLYFLYIIFPQGPGEKSNLSIFYDRKEFHLVAFIRLVSLPLELLRNFNVKVSFALYNNLLL